MIKIKSGQIPNMRRPRRASVATPVIAGPTPVPIEDATALPPEMQEEKGGGPLSIETSQPANFVLTETAIPGGATMALPMIAELIGANDFEDDLQRTNHQSGSALYISWRDKLVESLALAYVLYLHVLLAPARLNRLFEDSYFSGARKRALPKKKTALAALQYVTKPYTEDDRKSASAYATMLIYARHKGITAQRFPVEMPNVTLQEARAFVRDLPKQKASRRELAPAKPTLTLSYHSGSEPRRYVLKDVSFSTDNERQSLAERIVKTLHEAQNQTP